jgi:hypothetical protein
MPTLVNAALRDAGDGWDHPASEAVPYPSREQSNLVNNVRGGATQNREALELIASADVVTAENLSADDAGTGWKMLGAWVAATAASWALPRSSALIATAHTRSPGHNKMW